MSWHDVVLSVLLSIVASYIFWILTFKVSFAKVIFSNNLVKSDFTYDGIQKFYGYRFRIANIGYRDLIELNIVAKLSIKNDKSKHICFLDISNLGEQYFVTSLAGFKSRKKLKESFLLTLTLYPSESMQHELTKIIYPKEIRKRAKKGKIELQDIFKKYENNFGIKIYVYGNDAITGARKMFTSKEYTIYDIEEGDFCKLKEINYSIFDRIKVKQEKISQVHKKVY